MRAKLSLFIQNFQIAYRTEQLLWKKFFDEMHSFQSDKMTAFWQNKRLTFIFLRHSTPNWTTFVKEVFDMMLSLDSDKMTGLWPKGSFTFTFYVTFSYSIPNWTTFVKEVFWYDV